MELTKPLWERGASTRVVSACSRRSGFLHEGHLALMDLLRAQCDTLVVSLFVNPTQFDDMADFDAYPRDVDRDAGLAERAHGGPLLRP